MAEATKDDVTNLAPELSGLDDGRFNWALLEANTHLTACAWQGGTGSVPDRRQTMGRALYAAHLLVSSATAQDEFEGDGRVLTSETVGPLTRSYQQVSKGSSSDSGEELDSTVYGQRFRRLLRSQVYVGGVY